MLVFQYYVEMTGHWTGDRWLTEFHPISVVLLAYNSRLRRLNECLLTSLRRRRPPRLEAASTHSTRSRVHASHGGSPELPLEVMRIDGH
jgi:hypothetical protein